jgi:uncharacterized protein with HEPN domain
VPRDLVGDDGSGPPCIVDFRNQLTHEYPTIDDTIVWAIADRDVPVLQRECQVLLDGGAGGSE